MKMKKLWLGFAVCALITTSCSQQEMMENITDGQGQLSFAAGTAQQGTRAAELNNTTLQTTVGGNGIVLNAYQNVSGWKKWYDDKVVWNKNSSGKWDLDKSIRFRNENPTKYISYFSKVTGALTEVIDDILPSKSTFETANFTDKFPQFTYTVQQNSAKQEDLIAGITDVDAYKTNITLGMRHILSQVNFGTVGYKGAKIQIRNIKIVGIKYKGIFKYEAANNPPIGVWTDLTTPPIPEKTEYNYYNYTNTTTTDNNDEHALVPATAISGDKYIFGDGGNAGPGRAATTWYPTSKDNYEWKKADATGSTGLDNSLMLLPQTLTDAKVTFEYKIQDVDDAYVAGNDKNWAKGEFKLDFTTGTGLEPGKHYLGKWEQNYRYVYLIDFTDFLDGIALTFKVDVDMYEWENYNKGTNNDGIVDIMAAGQPSQADMNAATFVNGETFYIASRTPNKQKAPSTADWAQVIRNEIWNLSTYDFANIGESESFTLSFQNVIFNTTETNPTATTITMTLPVGYTAEGTGITMTGTNPYSISSGDKTSNAKVTIKNTNQEYLTAAKLQDAVKPLTANDNLIYKGTTDVNLRAIEPTSFTQGITVTVKFINGVVPTVGDSDNGRWTWNAATKTATWVKR